MVENPTVINSQPGTGLEMNVFLHCHMGSSIDSCSNCVHMQKDPWNN